MKRNRTSPLPTGLNLRPWIQPSKPQDLSEPTQPDSAALSASRLKAVFDAVVFQNLRPGTIGLGILYFIFSAAHYVLLSEPAKSVMSILALSSGVLLLAFWFALRHRPPPMAWAHPLVTGIAAIVLGNSLAHMYLAATPRDTTNLILLVIGCGCIFLSTGWLAGVLGATFLGWWWVATRLINATFLSYFDFGLLSASALAVIIHFGRVRAYSRIEELHYQDEQRATDLESALKSAEREITERKRAEAALHEAREKLESRVRERTHELAVANEALRNEIAERRRIEAALRKSEANLVLAQKIGQVGSWDLEVRTGVLNWSDETFRIFGRGIADFIPTRESFLTTVHPDDRTTVQEAFEQALRTHGPYAIDHRILRPDGSERLVCERAEFIFDAQGQAIQLIGTVQDITERKQLETQFRHSQKMDAIGQLAAGVAHDFNNILTVIHGHASLMLDLCRHDPEKSEMLTQVTQAADRAAGLTSQLLLFSRKQMLLHTDQLDLNAVIQGWTQMVHRILGEDIALVFNPAAGLPAIEADPGMLEQILMNLAVNARDAMPRGGKLTISTSVTQVGESAARLNPQARTGSFVRLTVADTGHGIDQALLPRIFEPFFTTKPVGKGTGLGLSTVYGIVQQHKGWVEVASEVNRGTSFAIFFPAVPKMAESAGERTHSLLMLGGRECLLVVEDEPALRQLVCRTLRRNGYQVLASESGAAALPIWEQHWHEIDLLLTDLVMPGGVSGRELAQRCLARKPGLKVIYTSGYSADLGDLEPSLREGIYFLPKPYQFTALTKLIRVCLSK